MNKATKAVLCSVIIFIFRLLGCQERVEDKPLEDILIIQPASLFEGEERKYKPFMGYTAAVRLIYAGEHRQILINTEIWEDGELKDTRQMIYAELSSSNLVANVNNRLIIVSIDDSYVLSQHGFHYISISDGYSFRRSGLDLGYGRGFMVSLQNEIQLSVGEKAYILAYLTGENDKVKIAPLERVDEAEYGKMVKFSFELVDPIDQ